MTNATTRPSRLITQQALSLCGFKKERSLKVTIQQSLELGLYVHVIMYLGKELTSLSLLSIRDDLINFMWIRP
jgi:hypothetical protein